MQITITMRYHFISTRVAIINTGEDVENWTPLLMEQMMGGIVKWCRNTVWQCLKMLNSHHMT